MLMRCSQFAFLDCLSKSSERSFFMLTGFHCFFYSLTAIQSKITKKVNIIILFQTMDTESIEDQPRKSNKSPMQRSNFSECGKLCDQNFYLLLPNEKPPKAQDYLKKPLTHRPKESTYGFSSVSREKRGNHRVSICLPTGQFSYYPEHFYGSPSSPRWSFSKDQKYDNEKVAEYEICQKHPLAKANHEKMYSSTSSLKESMRDTVRLMKNTSMQSTVYTRNYSIIGPRETSPVGFFQKSKISKKFYLTRQQVMNGEEELQKKVNKERIPCPEGYIKFGQKRARHPNDVMKGFQKFLPNYEHEKQYNNFNLTDHPTKPEFHINFKKHIDRKKLFKEKMGPNPNNSYIDFTRVNKSNINLKTKKFRSTVRTRYDRVQAPPNTRIDYDPHQAQLGGMVTMDKVIDRSQELFPIVDPIIKKAGDQEMKKSLQKSIPKKEFNEAHRPKYGGKVQL